MNCKVIRPQDVSFPMICKEVLEGENASVLCSEGVRNWSAKLMAEDFQRQQRLRSSKERACFYSTLEFQANENPSDETLIEIGEKYLQEIKITNTQYAIVKRVDGSSLFLQIIANMVDSEGNVIKDNFIWIRAEKAARKLTKEYFATKQRNQDLVGMGTSMPDNTDHKIEG